MRIARRVITSGIAASLALALGIPMSAAVVRPVPDDKYGLSSYYGPRCMPIRGASTYHLGQDMSAAKGLPVKAIRKGTVIKAGAASGFGQVVVIRHKTDTRYLFSVYGHVIDGDKYVRVGQRVTTGQRIADVGSSGTSTAPHLHLEIWRDAYKGSGVHKDPLKWMNYAGADLRAGAAWANERVVPSSCRYFTTTSVNLRSGPGSGYPVIRTIAVNRSLTAKPGDGSGVWRRVRFDGTVGWMHANYVSPTVTSLGTRYVQVDGLRLRAKPSSSSAVRATLDKGRAVVKIHQATGSWVKVAVGGKYGYVAWRYLDTTKP